MKLNDIRAAESKLLVRTYDRNPISFVGGEGVHLLDENGVRYLDLLSGIGVCGLGYGHPAVLAAIDDQSRKLIHTSNLFYHPGQAELALRLTEMTGLDRVFLQQRHRGVGSRVEVGARLRDTAPVRRPSTGNKNSGAGTQFSRPDHGICFDHS